jgi:hypothetical protein
MTASVDAQEYIRMMAARRQAANSLQLQSRCNKKLMGFDSQNSPANKDRRSIEHDVDRRSFDDVFRQTRSK